MRVPDLSLTSYKVGRAQLLYPNCDSMSGRSHDCSLTFNRLSERSPRFSAELFSSKTEYNNVESYVKAETVNGHGKCTQCLRDLFELDDPLRT